MPTYERCGLEINELAEGLLGQYPDHQPLLDNAVKIDFVWAMADLDKDGEKKGWAIKHNGHQAYGLARKIGLKDRAKGHGDCEVLLDRDWWTTADDASRLAVLDHELHHFEIVTDENGATKTDDLGRPRLRLRHHDLDIGWFNCIAERHGAASVERKQAAHIMAEFGQLYWPGLCDGPTKLGYVIMQPADKIAPPEPRTIEMPPVETASVETVAAGVEIVVLGPSPTAESATPINDALPVEEGDQPEPAVLADEPGEPVDIITPGPISTANELVASLDRKMADA